MKAIKGKRNLLIKLFTTVILSCIGLVAVTGLTTKKDVLTVCAAEELTITVPTADYEFTITKSGTQYSAVCNKALTIQSKNNLTDLFTAIDYAAGGGKVKKLIFDGGNGEPLDMRNINCDLSSGTYILDGMLTGVNIEGIICLKNNATIYIESAIISAPERAFINYGSGSINITGGTISSNSSSAIYSNNPVNISQAIGATTLITSGSTATTVQFNSNDKLIITGGTLQNTSSGSVIRNDREGSVEISGGLVQNTSSGIAIDNPFSGTVTINGTALVTSKNNDKYNGTIKLYYASARITFVGGCVTNTANGNVVYNPNGATVIIIPTIRVLNDVNTMVSIKLSYEKVEDSDYNILNGSGIRFGTTFDTTVYDKAGVLVIPTRLLGSNADIKEYFSNIGVYDAIDNPSSKLVNINAENTVVNDSLFFAGVIYNYPETRFGEELAAVCYYEYQNVIYLSKQIITSFVNEAQWYLANVTSLTEDQIAVLQIIAAK